MVKIFIIFEFFMQIHTYVMILSTHVMFFCHGRVGFTLATLAFDCPLRLLSLLLELYSNVTTMCMTIALFCVLYPTTPKHYLTALDVCYHDYSTIYVHIRIYCTRTNFWGTYILLMSQTQHFRNFIFEDHRISA